MNNKNLDKLLLLSLKKRKKNTIKKNFKKMLFFLAKKNSLKNKDIIDKAINNTLPVINLQKRKRTFKAVYISNKQKLFLGNNWIYKSVKKGNYNQYYKNLAEELINTANNNSLSVKQQQDFHKVALENMKLFIKK